jgi:hypothetical protein
MDSSEDFVVVEYSAEAGGCRYQVRVQAIPWKEVSRRLRRRIWEEGIVPRGEAPPGGVIYRAGVFGEGDPGRPWTARNFAATPEEAAFKVIPWSLFERGWAIVEGEPHAVFLAAQQMRRQAGEREAAAYAARRGEGRPVRERRRRYEVTAGGCGPQVRL